MLRFVFVNTLCFICADFQRENRDFCIPATVLIRVSVMIAIIMCGYHDYALGNRPEFYISVCCLYFVCYMLYCWRMYMIHYDSLKQREPSCIEESPALYIEEVR